MSGFGRRLDKPGSWTSFDCLLSRIRPIRTQLAGTIEAAKKKFEIGFLSDVCQKISAIIRDSLVHTVMIRRRTESPTRKTATPWHAKGIKLSDWLSKLHEYFLERKPFVLATITDYSGSSPDLPGAGLLYSACYTHRFMSSDVRYLEMLSAAKELLTDTAQYRTAKMPLGNVAGSSNGYCTAIYEYFDAQEYPTWLIQLRQHQSNGTSCALLREFDLTNSDGPVSTKVLAAENTPTDQKIAELTTYSKGNSLFLQRTVQNKNIIITMIGDHPVAQEISRQVETLPVTVNWITDVQQKSDTISYSTVVVVMTSDHDLDYQFCKFALTTNAKFVGCMGSEKKAAIFKKRLLESGVTPEKLQSFHMPVGMLQISGKQKSVVAASIVAQILAQHRW